MPTPAERFAQMTRPGDNGCLIWTGGHDKRGYGRFWHAGVVIVAARWALEQRLGRPLQEDMFACHTCDNPPCVEPTHLYEGTHQQNVDDMTGQLRHAWGERNARHRLTAQDVAEIRRLVTDGVSQRTVASAFEVDQSQVSRIVARRQWQNVP